MKCPIFTLAWTPEGRRLVTGASSGEFTLWNGLTFNFETILQVKWGDYWYLVEWSFVLKWYTKSTYLGWSYILNLKQLYIETFRKMSYLN